MDIWDWKFRIFFDSNCEQKLLNFIKTLDSDEQIIYKKIYNFYMSFFSIGELFNIISDNYEESKTYITKAIDNIDKVVFLPKRLKKYYIKQINKEKKFFNYKKQLLPIIEMACESKICIEKFWNEFAKIHNKVYLLIKKEFIDYKKKIVKIKQRKTHNNLAELFKTYYEKNCTNNVINNNFGTNKIKDFELEIKDGDCYGEWWDKTLTKSKIDKLILYTYNKNIKEEDFFYTIIHESYPGHGHFYNYLQNSKTQFDHGAILLIEGWATFCEWNTYPSKYVESSKQKAMHFLNLSFNSTYKNISKKFKKTNNLINVTQFFGYSESYYLGALMINKLIVKKFNTPQNFLEFLKTKNKGELFDLWFKE